MFKRVTKDHSWAGRIAARKVYLYPAQGCQWKRARIVVGVRSPRPGACKGGGRRLASSKIPSRERFFRAPHPLRLTSTKRMGGKVLAVKLELRNRMHEPIAAQGAYLRAVVAGHTRYFGVPYNGKPLGKFRLNVAWLWHRTLRRRSQTHHLSSARMRRLIPRWLPPARICHPYPHQRLIVTTQGRSRIR